MPRRDARLPGNHGSFDSGSRREASELFHASAGGALAPLLWRRLAYAALVGAGLRSHRRRYYQGALIRRRSKASSPRRAPEQGHPSFLSRAGITEESFGKAMSRDPSYYLDNETLIAAVEARPALWQGTHRDHKNRFKKHKLWSQVAAALLPRIPNGDSIVQKRWKSLRDKFRRFLTARQHCQQNGQAADELGEITWAYFSQLLFLKETMDLRPVKHIRHDPAGPAEEAPEDIIIENTECDIDTMSLVSVGSAADVPSPSNDSQPAELASAEPAQAKPTEASSTWSAPEDPSLRYMMSFGRQQKRRRKDEEELVQQLKKEDQVLSHLDSVLTRMANHKPPDEDEHFALSLISHMRAVKPEKKLLMRMNILQVLEDCK